MADSRIRIVLADDHAIVLRALESLLALETDMTVVAACTTGEATVEAVRRHHPDVLLLDLAMPGFDGLEVLRALRTEPCTPRVVLLTANIEDHQLLEALRLDVAGVFLKDMPPHLLLPCIRKVHAGEPWIETQSMARAIGWLLRQKVGERQAASLLTTREIEVVRMVAEGSRTRSIAARLNVSEGTIKTHLHNIYEKLQLDGRVALTVYAKEKGLV
jgi:DNA-binding NarL/FixJ family response regulator